MGHEVLWAIGEVISGEILVARALLSSSQEDLSRLLTDANMGSFGLLVMSGMLNHPGRLWVCGEIVIRGGLVGKNVDAVAAETY